MNNNLGRQGLAIAHPSPDGEMASTWLLRVNTWSQRLWQRLRGKCQREAIYQ